MCVILLLAVDVRVQAQVSEDSAIDYVRKLSPSVLDSTLPKGQFSTWLKDILGNDDSVAWEMNDCGEQTGVPAVDSARNIPVCVQVIVHMADGRSCGIMISIGTVHRGLIGSPGVFDIYLEDHGKFRTIHRLSELRHILTTDRK